MHLFRCHAALSLLLPLLLASVVVVLVEASTATFLPRNLRSSLAESKRQVQDANTILLKRSANLPFGLLVRGGHADNGESTQMESVAETKVDTEPTAEEVCNNEEITSSERYQSAWEEEIN